MATRNTKNVPYYLLGSGVFLERSAALSTPAEKTVAAPLPICRSLFPKITNSPNAFPLLLAIRSSLMNTSAEPTVEYIDILTMPPRLTSKAACRARSLASAAGPCSTWRKPSANLLTNPGKAEEYQGWDLVNNPAPYKIGGAPFSGTGAECSRAFSPTCAASSNLA